MTRTQIAAGLVTTGCIMFCVTIAVSNPLNNLAIGLIILGWLIEGEFSIKFQKLINTVLILPVAFYLLHIAALAYTSDMIEAFKHLETKAAILLLPMCLGTTRLLTASRTRQILRTFVLSNLMVLAYCFVVAAVLFKQTGNIEKFYYHNLTEILDLHAIYFAMYLGLSILVILFYFYFREPLFGGAISFSIVAFFLISIVLLAALSLIVLLPLLIIYLLEEKLLQRWSKTQRISIAAACLIAFGLLAYTIPYTRQKFEKLSQTTFEMGYQDYQWGSLTIRLAKWKCAADVLEDSWLVGVGTGDEQNALMESYRKNGFSEGLRNNYNTHNQYLETWIMLGIPGLLLLLAMLWPLSANALWTCFLALNGVFMLTENILDTQKGVVFFAFFYALIPTALATKSPSGIIEGPVSPH